MTRKRKRIPVDQIANENIKIIIMFDDKFLSDVMINLLKIPSDMNTLHFFLHSLNIFKQIN